MAELILPNSDEENFARLVEALRPDLDRLVFIGGWAHRLYWSHSLAQTLDYAPLMTRDADVAINADSPATDQDIGRRLLAAGFVESFTGESNPPVTHYQLGEHGGFYAEFVTPLIGSARRRSGTLEVTTSIAGITAQKLRYLDLLLLAPWSVSLDSSTGIPLSSPADVRIPNVASYLVQKLLIRTKRRTSQQRAKDVLYIHDTIELFGSSLGDVRSDWIHHLKPNLGKRDSRRVRDSMKALFAEVSDEVRDAAVEAGASSGRTLSVESIREVCRTGLDVILGESS